MPENELLRNNYKALISHCDAQVGRLLDKIDALNMWEDTVVIVTTDHGFLLGEHEWWAKNRMPCYNEVAQIPMFMSHPDHLDQAGTRRGCLTQTIDLAPTLLSCFGLSPDMGSTARSLLSVVSDETIQLRDHIIYGYFGGAVNITDGKHTYMRYPAQMSETNLNEYTLMPNHMLSPFSKTELQSATFCDDLTFAKGFPVLKIPVHKDSHWFNSHGPGGMADCDSVLFDLQADPGQLSPIQAPEIEARLVADMKVQMIINQAPEEAFVRLGF